MPPVYQANPEILRVPSSEAARALALPVREPTSPRIVIGHREWVSLPELGIDAIRGKTDSGAYSSSLHAGDLAVSEDGKSVSFITTNFRGETIRCSCPIARTGHVRSSNGLGNHRIFIETSVRIAGGFEWRIHVSLANRAEMISPLLLGRKALAGYFLVEPDAANLLGTRRALLAESATLRKNRCG